MTARGPRWARRLVAEGTDPDPRFSLANERTFLAWTRTSLALVAGGVALGAFELPALDELWRRVIAVVLLALGAALAVGAFLRWQHVERAMRAGDPVPPPSLAPLLAFGIAGVALVLVVLTIVVTATPG